MGRWRLAICIVSVLLWGASGALVRAARTDSVEEKLATITDYVPKAPKPVDQLVEVAQRFKIPMGIEWVDKAFTTPLHSLPKRTRTVMELLEEIAGAPSEYRVEADSGLVRIYSPTASEHPFNFLNIRLKNYDLKDEDLFAAEQKLRLAITFTLEPEKYRNGYNGGYGYGNNHIFQIPKFSLSVSNVSIREILNRIALAQGNALWVAIVKGSDLEGNEPAWIKKQTETELPITSAWSFFPLSEMAELAKEQVAVDMQIAGVWDERMTTIPVILEHGLVGPSGGSHGGFLSDGTSFQFSATIEKTGKDFVTLLIHLKVVHPGEADVDFEERLKVHNDRISEIRREPRIRIRAYFEPASNASDCCIMR